MNIQNLAATGDLFVTVRTLKAEDRFALRQRRCEVVPNPMGKGYVIVRGQLSEEKHAWQCYDAAMAARTQ